MDRVASKFILFSRRNLVQCLQMPPQFLLVMYEIASPIRCHSESQSFQYIDTIETEPVGS